MSHATSIWSPLPRMFHQSQTFLCTISFINIGQTTRLHPKNNPPFSNSSKRFQPKLTKTTETWETQLLWVRNIRLKSRTKITKNPIREKVIS